MNEKREIQKELFEEFSQPARLRRKALRSETARKIYNISLSNEQLIFIFIGLIILLVICFSLGVERGKKIAIVKRRQSKEEFAVKEKIQVLPEDKQAPKKVAIARKNVLPYVIQVAAYKDNKQAEREKDFLEKKGHNAEVIRGGKYSIVYVVGFENKKEAEKVAINLKNRYKDCFIKKRK